MGEKDSGIVSPRVLRDTDRNLAKDNRFKVPLSLQGGGVRGGGRTRRADEAQHPIGSRELYNQETGARDAVHYDSDSSAANGSSQNWRVAYWR